MTYELVLYPDPDLCLGCKTCEIACAAARSSNKDVFSAVAEGIKPNIEVVYVGVPVPMNCRHCEDAPCMEVCPTSAIYRTDIGPIVLDRSKCIGCRSCIVVCPYGAIKFDGLAYKCGQCVDRLRNNLLPACVEACPVGALKFERANDISKNRRLEAAKGFVRAKEEEEEKTTAAFRDLIWIVR